MIFLIKWSSFIGKGFNLKDKFTEIGEFSHYMWIKSKVNYLKTELQTTEVDGDLFYNLINNWFHTACQA